MEGGSYKLLESATHRTLHAHSFSRASSQASNVLTDLLSRYLTLLSLTCAKYAHHAGRTGLTARDAIGALDELGLGLEELSEYCSLEGKELGRYAIHSARRVEDMNEFGAQLADGLRQDRDDAIPLYYARHTTPQSDEDEDVPEDSDTVEHDSTVDALMDIDMPPPRSILLGNKNREPPHPTTPLLPLSPISNLLPPSHNRSRIGSWQPPPHIPDFLPPFPTTIDSPATPVVIPSPKPDQFQLLSVQAIGAKVEKPSLSLTQTISSSLSASDYLVQVPYSQSSLSGVAEWHLPSAQPALLKSVPGRQPRLPTPQTEQALFTAYHHILTHPPPSNGNFSTPSRHKVTMALLSQIQTAPRWEPPDTLYSSVAPCPPRLATIGPTYPMAIGDTGSDSKTKTDVKFPPAIPRPVSSNERLTPLISQQASRIPDLARHALPPAILTRTSRLSHPPVLQRGSKLLVYGPGVPAPWNANSPTPADANPPLSAKLKEGINGTSGKSEDSPVKPVLPDARLYATWDYEPKDFRVPLASTTRTRGRMGSVQGGSGVISLALGPRGKSKNN